LIGNTAETDLSKQTQYADIDFEKLIAENKALKDELTARREENQQTYVPKPLDLSEYKTRKIYIDAMLLDAGWTEGKDWINWYLWERKGINNNEVLPCYNEDGSEFYVNTPADLWDLVESHRLTPCIDSPCILAKKNV
jgi:hypothetical protein